MKRNSLIMLLVIVLFWGCEGLENQNDLQEGIVFVDSNLERAVREELGKFSGAITTEDCEGIYELHCYPSTNGITDLSGIENLTNLTFLELGGQQISNIDPIGNLTNLEYLVLYENQISDITPVSNLNNLIALELYNNNVTDISPVVDLSNMEYIGVLLNPLSAESIATIQSLESDDFFVAFNEREAGDWVFDHDNFLIINLAIGGNLGGEVDDTAFPQTMEIDYIRVYDTNGELSWSDEFDGTEVDMNYWNFEVGNEYGFGNNELQYYREENAVVSDGTLKITARNEAFNNFSYTSARINTVGKYSFTYGIVEARVKLPSGGGTWGAVWTLGDNMYRNGWPECGEIDIMEYIGNESGNVLGYVHGPGYSGGEGIGTRHSLPEGEVFSDEFHTFYINWTEDRIEWCLDSLDAPYFSVLKDSNGKISADPIVYGDM